MGNPYVEQIAGIISEQLLLPGQSTEKVLAELEAINTGDGFTIDIQHGHEGHRSWTRHEGVKLPDKLWQQAVALGMQWAGLDTARTKSLRIRLSEDEHARMTANAEEAGQTISEFVRSRCL